MKRINMHNRRENQLINGPAERRGRLFVKEGSQRELLIRWKFNESSVERFTAETRKNGLTSLQELF